MTVQWISGSSRLRKPRRPVNVLVNNAGICKFEMFEKLEDRDIEQIMNLNSIVPMKLTRKLLSGLKAACCRRGSSILLLPSALSAFPGTAFTRRVSTQSAGFRRPLRVNCQTPAYALAAFCREPPKPAINSARVVEMNRKLSVTMDSPEKVADAVVKFISSNRSELALGWPEKLLVRINSVFPTLVGNAISKKLPLIKQYTA